MKSSFLLKLNFGTPPFLLPIESVEFQIMSTRFQMKSSFPLKLNFGTLPFLLPIKSVEFQMKSASFQMKSSFPLKLNFTPPFFIADKECGVPDKECQFSDEKFISSKIEFWHTPFFYC